ncbi:MAG: hypothetical protein AAFV43_10130 [Planctomycetota bacterium]
MKIWGPEGLLDAEQVREHGLAVTVLVAALLAARSAIAALWRRLGRTSDEEHRLLRRELEQAQQRVREQDALLQKLNDARLEDMRAVFREATESLAQLSDAVRRLENTIEANRASLVDFVTERSNRCISVIYREERKVLDVIRKAVELAGKRKAAATPRRIWRPATGSDTGSSASSESDASD